jgi:ABC-type uncharacterized transport system ATPase subunit
MRREGSRVELDQVTMRFGALTAVEGVSLTLEPGRVHALIGENGAGKSTVLALAAGALTPTSGEVRVDGARLESKARARAAAGIGMVHQHFMLVESMTGLDNLLLGHELVRGPASWRGAFGLVGALGVLDRSSMRARARAVQSELGLELDLERPVSALGVGDKQRLEIVRVLVHGARALLLDEPTAVLTPREADDLFAVLRRLAGEGRTLAVVTHRPREVARHCDEVTVLRRGRVVLATKLSATGARAQAPASAPDALTPTELAATEARLTQAIMGDSSLAELGDKPSPAPSGPALVVRGLTLRAGAPPLSLEVRAGEIVGVAGIEGNGQRELVRALAGLDEPRDAVALGGTKLRGQLEARVAAARARGAAVHEDRHREGLLLDATVHDNLVLGELASVPRADEAGLVASRVSRYDVRPPEPERLARELSGGNQQKLVVARALERLRREGSMKGALLVLAHPTRGVDLGAARVIHRAVLEAAREGAAVVVVSADLDELRALATRLVVLRDGALVAELDVDAPDELVGAHMLGTHEPRAQAEGAEP